MENSKLKIIDPSKYKTGKLVKDGLDIREHIVIHMVTDGQTTKGWLHTHGMKEFGLPELEMKGIPRFLFQQAGILLNHVAQYMYDVIGSDNPVRLGQNMQAGPMCFVKFVKATPIPGDEEHYSYDVWEVTEYAEFYDRCCMDPRHQHDEDKEPI